MTTPDPTTEPVPTASPTADHIRKHLDAWRGWDMATALLAVIDEHQQVTFPGPPNSCGPDCCAGCPITMCQACGGGGDGEECITVQAIACALHITAPDCPADDGRSTDVPLAREATADPAHDPCCSSHGVPMDCATYRRTHFVEVGPCCSAWPVEREPSASKSRDDQ